MSEAIAEKFTIGYDMNFHLPSGWKWIELGQLQADEKRAIISGPFGSNIGSRFFQKEGVPVIRGNNLSLNISDKFIDEGFVFLSQAKADELNTWATKEDILFTAAGTIGQVGLIHENSKYKSYIISNKQIRVRLNKNKIIPLYAYYWLSQPLMVEYIKQRNTGSTIPLINLSVVKSLPIALPPLALQSQIVSILSSIDEKIELNRQTAQTLEAIAQAIFKEWFVDFNFPGATGEMQKSELGKIPKGWRVVSFEEELNADRGLSYKGNGLSQSDGVPMHNLNSVLEGGGYKKAGIKYYTGEFKEKHVVKPGDLIIANTEQGHKYLLIGYPAIIPAYYGEKGIFSHHIYKLKPKQHSYLTSEFLFHLLLQPEVREQVTGFANGTTVNMLKIDGLQKPKFVFPPKDIVQRFTEVASSLRNQSEESLQQNQTLTQLRDELLPKLMRGEITINKI